MQNVGQNRNANRINGLSRQFVDGADINHDKHGRIVYQHGNKINTPSPDIFPF